MIDFTEEEYIILERAINKIGWPEINAYYEELRRGQAIREDEAGFFKRCIASLFGVMTKDEVVLYQDATRAMFGDGLKAAGHIFHIDMNKTG